MSDIGDLETKRATTDDIREWARQQGRDIPETGSLPRGLRREYNEAHGIPTASRQANYEGSSEVAPKVKEPSVSNRVGTFFKGKKNPPRRTRARKPRVSAEDVISSAWSLLAQMVQPISVPMAKAMAMEAPVAGKLLDEPIRGTFIDKVLQPFARAEESGKVFAALAAPPIFVGLIDRFPERAPSLLPGLRRSLKLWIDVAGPKLEEIIQEEAEFEEKYGKSIDGMIISFFPDLFEPEDNFNASDSMSQENFSNATVG